MSVSRKVFFIHKHPLDPQQLVLDAIHRYHCDAIAYCVMDGEKPMNTPLGVDRYLPKILKHATSNGLQVFAYHRIHGANPEREAKLLASRLKNTWRQLAGIIVYVKPDYRQEAASPMLYLKLVRLAFPGKSVQLVCHDRKFDGVPYDALVSGCDSTYVIVSDGGPGKLWDAYRKAWLWLKAMDDKPVYPVFCISDIAERGYKVQPAKVKTFWQTFMYDDAPSCGLWNWYPENGEDKRMIQDGHDAAAIRQLVAGMTWTRQPKPVLPPVDTTPVPPVVVPVIPEYTRDENIDHLIDYAKMQRWIP